jgi:hypothetical protein
VEIGKNLKQGAKIRDRVFEVHNGLVGSLILVELV